MSKLNEDSKFNNFLAPDSGRPGSVDLKLTRMDLISLIDSLENCDETVLHIKNYLTDWLKICISIDIEYMRSKSESYPHYSKYIELLKRLEAITD